MSQPSDDTGGNISPQQHNGSVIDNDTNADSTVNTIHEFKETGTFGNPAATPVTIELKVDLDQDNQVNTDGLRQRIQFSVERPVLTEPDLAEDYDGGPRKLKSPQERFSMLKERYRCSAACSKRMLLSFFPFIDIMKGYNIKTDIIGDLVAGLTVGIMQIPQGMAYAVLASMDAVYGLYMSFFPIIVYFFFGTSRHLSYGTFAVISLMVGSAVDRLCSEEEIAEEEAYRNLLEEGGSLNGSNITGVDVGCAIGVASALTFLGGIMQICMGLLQLGFVVIYLSEPMTRGFTTGASIHVFSSQLKSIFGVSIPRHNGAFKLIYTYRDLVLALPNTNPAAVIASVICSGVIFVVKEFANPPVKKKIKAPIPIDLVIVVAGTAASYFGNFETRYDLEIVGKIPTGIPAPRLPPVERFSSVVVDGLVIAVVSYAISISMAQLFAKRNGYTVDANQELMAHGITNLVCSNFNCYLMSVSLSRSLVQENVGGVTQIAGLISSALMLVVLLALAGLFEALPSCVLAAIIVVALKGMFMQVLDLKRLWRVSKTDMSVWLVTFLAVVLLDIDLGLLVGVGWSFLTVIGRTQRPYVCEMGRVGETDMYADTRSYEKAKEIPGVKIIRFENSVYFANREYFVNRIYQKARCNPKDLGLARKKMEGKRKKAIEAAKKKNPGSAEEGVDIAKIEESYPLPVAPIHHVILDCSTMGFLDSMGVAGISMIINDYKAVKVEVFLSGCKPGIQEMLETSGVHEKIPKSVLFPTLHDAVLASLREKPVQEELLNIRISEDSSLPPSYSQNQPSPAASSSDSQQNSEPPMYLEVLPSEKEQQAMGIYDNKAFSQEGEEALQTSTPRDEHMTKF